MLLLQLHTLSVLAKKDFVKGYNCTPALSPSARLELSNCKALQRPDAIQSSIFIHVM